MPPPTVPPPTMPTLRTCAASGAPRADAAGAAGALELAAVPQDDRLAPTVRSTKLEKRQPVPAAPVRYEAVNGVGPLIPARLQKALTATIAPLLEAHERALPEVKERLRRRVHFGERWRNHEEFFRTADPLLLRSVDANATRLNKNLLKHARLADDCNLKLEGLVGLTEARAAERADAHARLADVGARPPRAVVLVDHDRAAHRPHAALAARRGIPWPGIEQASGVGAAGRAACGSRRASKPGCAGSTRRSGTRREGGRAECTRTWCAPAAPRRWPSR